jgi:hypothetical protein
LSRRCGSNPFAETTGLDSIRCLTRRRLRTSRTAGDVAASPGLLGNGGAQSLLPLDARCQQIHIALGPLEYNSRRVDDEMHLPSMRVTMNCKNGRFHGVITPIIYLQRGAFVLGTVTYTHVYIAGGLAPEFEASGYIGQLSDIAVATACGLARI